MSILGPWLKSLGVMSLAVIWSLVSTLIATMTIAVIEHWDDAPGNGIFMLMVGMWTLSIALTVGLIVCSDIFKYRAESRPYPFWKAAIGMLLAIFAVSIIPTAFFVLIDGWGKQGNRFSYTGIATVLVLLIAVLLGVGYRQFPPVRRFASK
jgi:hypothetical protein